MRAHIKYPVWMKRKEFQPLAAFGGEVAGRIGHISDSDLYYIGILIETDSGKTVFIHKKEEGWTAMVTADDWKTVTHEDATVKIENGILRVDVKPWL
ncbi:MAG: hypothetical protein KatS3mg022_3588 [Armatimonadota bacterium]|nr:MAG: hypothetical protein KatS3mg022_3588 [Armatimonadota bacterium]